MNKEFVIQSNNRLIYFKKEKVDQSMWENQWEGSIKKHYYKRSLTILMAAQVK